MLTTRKVSLGDEALAGIMVLHRENSKTLGFFPQGAFEEYARKGHLLGAFVGEELVGYVASRGTRQETVLVHFCVADAHRGTGVARGLFEAFKAQAPSELPIVLTCREDYLDASRMWGRFGFLAKGGRTGRGKDKARLVLWRYERGDAPPLLELLANAALRDRLRVAVDANAYFDLVEGKSPQAEESKALLADWLDDLIVLCVTPEMGQEARRGGHLPGWDVTAGALC